MRWLECLQVGMKSTVAVEIPRDVVISTVDINTTALESAVKLDDKEIATAAPSVEIVPSEVADAEVQR